MFSKTYCPFCKKPKSSLVTAGAKVAGYPGAHVLELDTMGEEGAAVQEYLALKTGRRTVPSVFTGGKPFGGGGEVAAALSAGTLPQMLATAVGGKLAAGPALGGDAEGAKMPSSVTKN